MHLKMTRIAILTLAGGLIACDQGPPTYVRPARPPAVTGTFALRLVDGKPLPQRIPEFFIIEGLPDRLILTDTLKLSADFRFEQRSYFAWDTTLPNVPPEPKKMSSFFTQYGDELNLFGAGTARVRGDSLFLIPLDFPFTGVIQRWTYTRTVR